jgi:hypothetical protein
MRPDQTDPALNTMKGPPQGGKRRANDVAPSAGDGATAVTWQDIKSRFVDDPTGALAAAEQLVRQAVDDRVRALEAEAAAICARERDEGEPSTETLRTRLIRYQAYCDRLAAASPQ